MGLGLTGAEAMAIHPHDTPSAGPQPAVHQGRELCWALLRQGLLGLGAAAAGAVGGIGNQPRGALRQAWLIDRHFSDWPLDEAAVLDSLSAWLRPGGRVLRIIGVDFESTARALPRFARWRRDWSHRIEVLSPVDGQLPAAWRGLLAGAAAWQWLDAPDWRLRVLTDAVHVRAVEVQVADFLQRCEPAWPATTLGL